ncbi:MAG: hypothetical protein KF784_12965 [Fimbriimonadaceae bacterium]|nr:hypothetical protein [Fimbriimonadaceae bacterium]
MKWAKIGLYLAKGDSYAAYYREALEHVGIPFTPLDTLTTDEVGEFDVILLCGYGSVSNIQRNAIGQWLQTGGSLVASGSSWGLDPLFGLDGTPQRISNGTLTRPKTDRLWPEHADSIRFFGGELMASVRGQNVVPFRKLSAVNRIQTEKGIMLFIGPHIGQTMCQMQMGVSVETDGIGPDDDSAHLDDQILRAEDGIALSFESDRITAEGASHPHFAKPHADLVREIWVRAVIEAIEASGACSVMTWYWPKNADSVAALTIDSEEYDYDHVHRAHTLLTMFGCQPAWVVATPGYTLDVYRTMRSWGHEIGLLFTGEEGGYWHEERLKIQHLALGRAAGTSSFSSSRPADGQWRNWRHFYEMCDTAGVKMSLSKGGRQPGTSGFAFGTCHPFSPIRKDGTPNVCAELPYHAYLPGEVTCDQSIDAIIEEASAVHGCFHAVIRSDSVDNETVNASLRRMLAIAKQAKMVFYRPDELYAFERTRRNLRLWPHFHEEHASIQIIPDADIDGLVLMFIGQRPEISMHRKEAFLIPMERFGTRLWTIDLRLDGKTSTDLSLKWPIEVAA